jgi:hypothetical protein
MISIAYPAIFRLRGISKFSPIGGATHRLGFTRKSGQLERNLAKVWLGVSALFCPSVTAL